jgi:hypothetical protein
LLNQQPVHITVSFSIAPINCSTAAMKNATPDYCCCILLFALWVLSPLLLRISIVPDDGGLDSCNVY